MQTFKEVFNIRPVFSRYVTTWSVTKVSTFIKSKRTPTYCDLKKFLINQQCSCALATVQRDQTIKSFNLDYIKISSDMLVLFVPKTLKTTKPRDHLKTVTLNLRLLNTLKFMWQLILNSILK